MSIKLSGVPVWDGGDIPAGSYIPTAIKIGASSFTLRKVNPNQVGAVGPAGSDGSTILNGAGAPAVGAGSNDDYYLNSTTGDFYVKSGGVWNLLINLKGPAGAAGANGTNGAPGAPGADGDSTEWLNGAGAPGAGLGENGDYYLNNSNGDYYFKAAGAWGLLGNLKGATGATGPAGGSEVVGSDGASMDLFESYSDGAISTFSDGIGWGDSGKGTNTTIVPLTHENGATHRALRLSSAGGEFARGLYVGEDWMGLDIFFTYRLNGAAANLNSAGNTYFFGVCSGLTNTLASGTCDNFLGLGNIDQDFTYTAGTRWNRYTGVYAFRAYSKRGVTITDQGGGSGSTGREFAQSEGHVTCVKLTIVQPLVASRSTARNFSMYSNGTASTYNEWPIPTRVAHSSNLWQREIAASSKNAEWTGGATQTWTVSFDESTGVFDTVVFYWANTDGGSLDIYGVSVRKRFY